jgi:hypothetical protein
MTFLQNMPKGIHTAYYFIDDGFVLVYSHHFENWFLVKSNTQTWSLTICGVLSEMDIGLIRSYYFINYLANKGFFL